MSPLSTVSPGEKFLIKTIYGGKKLRKKLINLGLKEGIKCEIITGVGHGGVIVKKDNCKIGIGYGMASKIYGEIL